MENGSSLAVIDVKPEAHALVASEYHRRATDVAGLVKAIVLGKAVTIGPRKYVPVDAYQAIANAMGCVASARDVRRVEGGYTAIGEVRRISDMQVLAEGEGFVGDDEPKWKNGPEYARRSMVQTRAIGRACRAAFAFVVPMIDLGLSSTPAEEMEGIATATVDPPAPVVRGTAALRNALNPNPSPPQSNATATHDRNRAFGFGRDKTKPLHALEEGSLNWYAKCLADDIASDDPKKQSYRQQNEAALADVRAELRLRGIA
jgi:hypothetical protein